jgi:hypothetical protein
MRRSARWLALLVVLIAAAPRPAWAQQLRGVVRDGLSALPVPGAVVSVLDSGGRAAGRTIADQGGRYAIALLPSAARIRVIRIGFQPVELPVARGTGGDATLDVTMQRLPMRLASVRVTDRPLCPGTVGADDALALWEQARAGLLAAVVAREVRLATMTTLVFERTLTPGDDRVRRMRVESKTGRTTRPFIAAAPPREFARIGYMQEDSTGRTYSAPDADVLLDESFAATHCLHIERADDAHRGQVGLAFAPVAGRDTLVDVEGVLWMDEKNPALRSVEFRFTGMEPAAASARAGGTLAFRTMANGVAFIEQWVMRMPVLVRTPLEGSNSRFSIADERLRIDRRNFRATEIAERGGEVAKASWPDGTRFEATPARVTGHIVQKGTKDPVAHALVSLDGTADTVATDASGAFVFSPVLPGRYTLRAADTTLDGFAAERTLSRTVDVARKRASDVALELPAIATVLAQLCRGLKMPEQSSIIVGRLSAPSGLPLRDVQLLASWQANFNGGAPISINEKGSTGFLVISGAQQVVDPDAAGRFRVCGVARGRPIKLSVRRSVATLADTVIFVRDSVIRSVDWRVLPLPPMNVAQSATTTTLPAVRSTAKRRTYISPSLNAFEERRASGMGYFISEEELRQHDNRQLSNILAAYLPGLTLNGVSGGRETLISGRKWSSGPVFGKDGRGGTGAADCFVTVYTDGIRTFDYTMVGHMPGPDSLIMQYANIPDFRRLDVSDYAGVEFYPGASTLPPWVSPTNSDCGVLLLWTREK